MAKVQRKVIRRKGRTGRSGLSTGMILLIVGGIVIVAVAIIVLAGRLRQPNVQAANVPTGLAMCGKIPCPTKGDSSAPVTIVDISSFVCSHCRDFFTNTEPKVDEQYVKTGKVYYILHPLGFDAQAQGLAAAAFCAGDQGKFWEYSGLLYQNQGQFDSNSLSLYAQQLGMDVPAFATCVNSGKYLNDAAVSTSTAQAAGVDATPSFFVNGKLVVGALPFQCKPGTPECVQGDFQTQIETALKRAQ